LPALGVLLCAAPYARWKHMPLPFHQKAVPASEATQEAFAQQGHAGFWRFHDALFVENRGQDILDRPSLERIAQAQGFDR
jgi:protein-disulfide isomerase